MSFLLRILPLKITVFVCFMVSGVFGGIAFAQNVTSGFGPYMTFASKLAKNVTVSYYTKKKENVKRFLTLRKFLVGEDYEEITALSK